MEKIMANYLEKYKLNHNEINTKSIRMATISNMLVIFPLLYQNIWYQLQKEEGCFGLFGARFF